MTYAYRILIAVADAEVNEARALVQGELGPVDGGGWFAIPCETIQAERWWLSSSALTAANKATIDYFQATPNALATLRYVFADAVSGVVTAASSDALQALIGQPLSVGSFLEALGLTEVAA